jgi:hypothetical protein
MHLSFTYLLFTTIESGRIMQSGWVKGDLKVEKPSGMTAVEE